MKTRELICINCPVGCKISIEWDDSAIKTISGNRCPKGEAYARKEVTDPRRIVTTTVEILGGEDERLPVKTKEDIPKEYASKGTDRNRRDSFSRCCRNGS